MQDIGKAWRDRNVRFAFLDHQMIRRADEAQNFYFSNINKAVSDLENNFYNVFSKYLFEAI